MPVVGFVLAGTVLGLRQEKKTKLPGFLMCALLFAGLFFQAACGGSCSGSTDGGGSPGTPKGQYTITVAGTSGSTHHSTTTALTVR